MAIESPYPSFLRNIGVIMPPIKTKMAAIEPIKAKVSEFILKTEWKNKFMKGMVNPAPIEIRNIGVRPLKILPQS